MFCDHDHDPEPGHQAPRRGTGRDARSTSPCRREVAEHAELNRDREDLIVRIVVVTLAVTVSPVAIAPKQLRDRAGSMADEPGAAATKPSDFFQNSSRMPVEVLIGRPI